jgi:hypothetical protein
MWESLNGGEDPTDDAVPTDQDDPVTEDTADVTEDTADAATRR